MRNKFPEDLIDKVYDACLNLQPPIRPYQVSHYLWQHDKNYYQDILDNAAIVNRFTSYRSVDYAIVTRLQKLERLGILTRTSVKHKHYILNSDKKIV